jgi:Uncharacterised nucleotidyltransferase
LTWWRLRNSQIASQSASRELEQAYRLHAIQAELHESNIKQVFKLLRKAAVEPILVKGWSIARLYPEVGLRPYGDIDLCVAPAQYAVAQNALREGGDRFPVDLHSGTSLLDDRSWDEVFDRSQSIMLDETEVRVLAPEDQLRVLSFHLLRHGVERPIGLCDIAVALEGRASDFDWNVCLGNNRKRADWIACVIALAKKLLGADLGELVLPTKTSLPAWFVKSVIRAWGRSFSTHFTQAAPMEFYLHHPRGLARALAARWPTPIMGTVGVGGSFNSLPRFPYQLGYLLLRSGRFLKRGS